MAQITRLLLVTAAAGTMLSGCSLIGSVADTTWSGTKTVAKWVSAPVRYVLRGSPETETQFAGAALETEEPVVPVEGETVMVAEMTDAHAQTIKAEPFETSVSTVTSAPVTSYGTVAQSGITQTHATMQTSSYQSSSYSSQSRTVTSGSHMTSVQTGARVQDEWEGPIRYSVETSSRGDVVHFVRLKGTSSMSDWMECDRRSEGYWLTGDTGGAINPAFEVCMRGLDYVLETEKGSYDRSAAVVESKISAPQTVDTGPVLAGGGDRPALRSSSYVPTQEPRSDLPHKF
ncbi:MAG: hypothetical protein AAF926_01725 [Pseudomonadota bacterium]